MSSGRDAGPGSRPPTAEESLDEALDHLERILDRRDGSTAHESAAGAGRSEEQYEIPLLDDVVTAGAHGESRTGDGGPADERAGGSADESEQLSRRIAERLASEIEIIVNDGMEEAVRAALSDAQSRIKEHLAIVLPEIVDEIRQARRRDD